MAKLVELLFVETANGWRCDAFVHGCLVAIGRGKQRVDAAVATRQEARRTRAIGASVRNSEGQLDA